MSNIKQWVLIDPLDTLFFKGSEPMVAGENHEVRSVFPPMPSTLTGALITAVLTQRGICPDDFTKNDEPDPAITEKYPLLGKPAEPKFKITGTVFLVKISDNKTEWFLPAPAHWFYSKPEHDEEDAFEKNVSAAELLTEKFHGLGLCGSVSKPAWVFHPDGREMKSLSGFWANFKAFESMKNGKSKIAFFNSVENIPPNIPAVVKLNALFSYEIRVGIALEPLAGKTKQGHLYSSTQVRLKPGVSMAVGLSDKLIPDYLDKQGIMTLGGEQRIVRYQLLDKQPEINGFSGSWMMSLCAFPYSELLKRNWEKLPRVSGPFIRMGGWNMKTRFHKDMKAYLPAGTVIWNKTTESIPYGFIRI